MVAFLSLAGCATTIFPPPAVSEPTKIGVLDHGRHASLIVAVPGEATMVRYSYGDWQWYALRETGATEATSAVFGPTQAALGRRQLAGPLSPDVVQRQVRVPIEAAIFLDVEAAAVRALIARLDGIFAENMSTRIYNEAYDLEFVHYPDPYSISHNSNRLVAEWLTALGCRVEGPAIIVSNWRRGTAID